MVVASANPLVMALNPSDAWGSIVLAGRREVREGGSWGTVGIEGGRGGKQRRGEWMKDP